MEPKTGNVTFVPPALTSTPCEASSSVPPPIPAIDSSSSWGEVSAFDLLVSQFMPPYIVPTIKSHFSSGSVAMQSTFQATHYLRLCDQHCTTLEASLVEVNAANERLREKNNTLREVPMAEAKKLVDAGDEIVQLKVELVDARDNATTLATEHDLANAQIVECDRTLEVLRSTNSALVISLGQLHDEVTRLGKAVADAEASI